MRRRDEARKLRLDGLPVRQIAARMGISLQSAYRYCAGLDLPRSSRALSDEAELELLKAWQSGATQQQLADQHGIARSTVSHMIKRRMRQ